LKSTGALAALSRPKLLPRLLLHHQSRCRLYVIRSKGGSVFRTAFAKDARERWHRWDPPSPAAPRLRRDRLDGTYATYGTSAIDGPPSFQGSFFLMDGASIRSSPESVQLHEVVPWGRSLDEYGRCSPSLRRICWDVCSAAAMGQLASMQS
jgi:hypothetical protein